MVCPFTAMSQQSVVNQINSIGTFDNWSVREIKESGIIGGHTKYLYEFYGSPSDTVRDNGPLVKPSDYPWRTNNVLAVVAGVTKTNTTVFPEKRDDGYCARIETHIESVNALGIKVNVVCQGGMLIGDLIEPIRDIKSPMLKVLYGIPFEGRPSALVFDYKTVVGNPVMKGTKVVSGTDYPEAAIVLQKRWVDSDGETHALRVGTGWMHFTETEKDWVNGYRLEVNYGDITSRSDFQDFQGLRDEAEGAFSVLNSKGKPVPVLEEGWAPEGTEPNFLIIKFLASCGEPFVGAVGNILWIDNVRLEM